MRGKVYLVDDEPDLRRALERLLRAEGCEVEGFSSAAEFLAQVPPEAPGCIVLDVAMPGIDGLAMQQRLTASGGLRPIVVLTGHGDIPMSVRAVKAGAVDFLTKPVKGVDLLRAVGAALDLAEQRQAQRAEWADLQARAAQLTPREREVFGHVIAGRLNKIIADRIGTTEQTVKVHRARVMDKMGAESVADLVRIGQRIGIDPTP
ncbi:MAG: response regulator transcription factor [Betaproteobacteria bacterium]